MPTATAPRRARMPWCSAQRDEATGCSTAEPGAHVEHLSRYGGDQVQVKEVELARALTRAAGHLLLDRPCSGWQRLVGTNDVPRRSVMTRLIALLVALVFVLGAGAAPAWSQAPAKPEQKAPPAAKKEPLDINSASANELKALAGIPEAGAQKNVEHPPYKRTDENVQKKGVAQATTDKNKEQNVNLLCVGP